MKMLKCPVPRTFKTLNFIAAKLNWFTLYLFQNKFQDIMACASTRTNRLQCNYLQYIC